jgi:hypothetical protein
MRRHRNNSRRRVSFSPNIAKDFKLKNNSAAEIGDVLGGDTNDVAAKERGVYFSRSSHMTMSGVQVNNTFSVTLWVMLKTSQQSTFLELRVRRQQLRRT